MRQTILTGLILATALTACTNGYTGEPKAIVSVKYDPGDYRMDELRQNAKAQCGIQGYRETPVYLGDSGMVGGHWNYMRFGCY